MMGEKDQDLLETYLEGDASIDPSEITSISTAHQTPCLSQQSILAQLLQ